jgi:hypothetical protein
MRVMGKIISLSEDRQAELNWAEQQIFSIVSLWIDDGRRWGLKRRPNLANLSKEIFHQLEHPPATFPDVFYQDFAGLEGFSPSRLLIPHMTLKWKKRNDPYFTETLCKASLPGEYKLCYLFQPIEQHALFLYMEIIVRMLKI